MTTVYRIVFFKVLNARVKTHIDNYVDNRDIVMIKK